MATAAKREVLGSSEADTRDELRHVDSEWVAVRINEKIVLQLSKYFY